LLGSFMLVPHIGGEFMPRQDKGKFRSPTRLRRVPRWITPPAKGRELEALLRQLPAVRSIQLTAGSSSFSASKTDGHWWWTWVQEQPPAQPVQRDAAGARQGQPGGWVEIESVEEMGKEGPGGKPINIGLRGSNLAELDAAATMLMSQLARSKAWAICKAACPMPTRPSSWKCAAMPLPAWGWISTGWAARCHSCWPGMWWAVGKHRMAKTTMCCCKCRAANAQ
jgi:multidrug efflux pump subunit AcrB